MITPTPGRVVWYRPDRHAAESGFARPSNHETPLAAFVTYVHGDRMVNLAVFDVNGVIHQRTNVPLRQDGDPVPLNTYSYCEWMPYQKGQAARTEQAEKGNLEKAYGGSLSDLAGGLG